MKTKILWIAIVLFLIVFGCDNGENVYEYTGIVEGVSVKVPALTGGKIINMNIKEGQFVEQNQLIAVIDTLELSINKDQVAASLEELAVQTEIAKTNLSRTNNDYNYIKDKFDRMSKLYQSKSIPKQTLDDVKNKYESIESALVSAKQNLKSIDAKRKQLQAQLKLMQKKISDAKISSPFAGYVTSKFFEAGEAIMPLNPIVEIINTKKMETNQQRILNSVQWSNPDIKKNVVACIRELNGFQKSDLKHPFHVLIWNRNQVITMYKSCESSSSFRHHPAQPVQIAHLFSPQD